MSQVYVEIYNFKTGEVADCMGPMSEASADRVECGALINMDRENWGTRQVKKPAKKKKEATRQ